MKKAITFLLIFELTLPKVFGQCDPDKEYSSEYFHSSYFTFMPSNLDRIEDSNGDFYELFFVDDSVSINENKFGVGKNNLFFTSGVLIRKISNNGETIYKKLNVFNSSHPPLYIPSRSSSSFVSLKNDTLILFGIIESGSYQTKKGNIILNNKIFGQTTFDPLDGSIYEIKTILNGIDEDIEISVFSLPMQIDGESVIFSFGTSKDIFDNISKDTISSNGDVNRLIVGSYNYMNHDMILKIIGLSKSYITLSAISKLDTSIYVSGVYRDSLELHNGTILLPKRSNITNSGSDGFMVGLNDQLDLYNSLSITGEGSFISIFNQISSDGNIFLHLNSLNSINQISTKDYDTTIRTTWEAIFSINSDFRLINFNNVEPVWKTEDDYVHVNMIYLYDNLSVLSITTNSEKIIYGGDTLPSLHQTNDGYTLFHIYIDNNGKRVKHQTYHSEGFFTLYPMLNDGEYTYFNGTQIKDIKGSYEIPFPNNAPFRYLTFMKNVCTEKLVHTPKIANTNSSKIYPNPTHSSITIENESIISNIQIVDLMGKVVYQNEGVNESIITLDISQFTNGLYIIKYLSDGKWNVGKVVKQ